MYRFLSLPLLFVVVLGIAGCTGAPQRPSPPAVSGLDASAQPLVAKGDYLAKNENVVLIEMLANLGEIGRERFTLVVLPLRFAGGDGAPARAVALLP